VQLSPEVTEPRKGGVGRNADEVPCSRQGMAAALARDSVGAALVIAARLGPAGDELAQAARTAFVDAMSAPALVGAGVALLGAVVAVALLPAHARSEK
jgi:hypothetical protein